jgi:hypothetical protein
MAIGPRGRLGWLPDRWWWRGVGGTASGNGAARRGGGGGRLGRVGGEGEEPVARRSVEMDPVVLSSWAVDPTTEALPEPGGTGRRRGQATREVRKGGVEGEGRLLGGGEVAADRWWWWKPAVGREVGARKGGRRCERKTTCMLGPWAGNAVEGKVMMVGPMLGSSAVGTRGSRVCLNGRALSAVKKSLFQHGRKNVSSRFHLVIKNKKAIRHQQRQRWSAGLTKPPLVGFRGSKKPSVNW